MGTLQTPKGGGGRNRFDDLPEELWASILGRVPHVTRLRSRSVCQHWKRFLSELEAAKPVMTPRCLALEMVGNEEEGECGWSELDISRERSSEIRLSFPPGWTPGVHGGIRGGGKSGLVAFWDRKANLYWVGSPVHDKWEKVREPHSYNHLRFHRHGFQLVAQRDSGFYKIVQFQWNELQRRHTFPQASSHPNFVIQVFCSRSRAWKSEEKSADPVVFSHLDHSCVCENRVYFLGTVKPPPDQETTFNTAGPGPHRCPTAIWALNVDSGVFSEVMPPRKLDFVEDGGFQQYRSSLQLHVLGFVDFKISVVGQPWPANRRPSTRARRMYVFGLDRHRNWVLERNFALHDLANFRSDLGEDWGLGFLAYEATEAHWETRPRPAPIQMHCSFLSTWQFDEEQKKWGQYGLSIPPYERDGELPVIQFIPCECLLLTKGGSPRS